MMIGFIRTIKFAFQNFWRNLWLSVITVFILMLTLFSISLVVTLNLLADQAILAIQDKIDVDIYFKQNTSEEEILAAQGFLQNISQVKKVNYISPEEALNDFKEQNRENADLQNALAELDENPLPASLVVQAYTLDDYDTIIQQFENSDFEYSVEEKNFSDHQIVINRLSSLTSRLYQFGLAVSGVFILIAAIMMFNTIRLAIYAHRDELAIMKLVGATNWFIRSPFLLESLVYVVLGSVLATALISGLTWLSSPYVNSFFTGYNFSLMDFYWTNFWYILLIQVLAGLVLAVGSTMISIGRYLRV